jgi:hypothetical protein
MYTTIPQLFTVVAQKKLNVQATQLLWFLIPFIFLNIAKKRQIVKELFWDAQTESYLLNGL